MDGVSVAASILGIAGAGVKISVELVTFATRIDTATERITAIGNDVALTAGVLQQLGDFLQPKSPQDTASIFSEGGLRTTQASADACGKIFTELKKATDAASQQLRSNVKRPVGKIKLSHFERLKWPFLQPNIDDLRNDLKEAKGTLMLMLQVITLGMSKKMAERSQSVSSGSVSQRDLVDAIVALQDLGLGPKQSQQSDLEPGFVSHIPNDSTANRCGGPCVMVTDTPAMTPATERSQTLSMTYKPGEGLDLGHMIGKRKREEPHKQEPLQGPRTNDLWHHERDDPKSVNMAMVANELCAYHLRPSCRDHFDKIELRWDFDLIQRGPGHMDPDCISPSGPSITMADTDIFERCMIQRKFATNQYYSIVRLKRYYMDIKVRGMTLSAVSGLYMTVYEHTEPSPIPMDFGLPEPTMTQSQCRMWPQQQQTGPPILASHVSAHAAPHMCRTTARPVYRKKPVFASRVSSASAGGDPRPSNSQSMLEIPESVRDLLKKYTTV